MKRLLWSGNPPTTSGYYWLKWGNDAEIVHVKRGRVYSVEGEGRFNLKGVRVDECGGKWHPVRYPSLADANKHETQLKQLAAVVSKCLDALDAVMKEPESNALDNANQAARIFGLGEDFHCARPPARASVLKGEM